MKSYISRIITIMDDEKSSNIIQILSDSEDMSILVQIRPLPKNVVCILDSRLWKLNSDHIIHTSWPIDASM